MSLPLIRYYLSQDYVDGDPAVVSAANVTYWPTSADVAPYAYQSLATIWLTPLSVTSVSASAALANTINYRKGDLTTDSIQSIILYSLPEDSYQNQDGMRNNDPGAQDYYMDILYKLPQGNSTPQGEISSFSRLMNTSMRVRYILDTKWRRQRGQKPLYLPNLYTVDPSIKPPGIICEWQGYVSPPNGTEVLERWLVRQEIIVPFS